jgi:hypothetical protein
MKISQGEALERIAEARDEHEKCPECGEKYDGVDMSYAGSLVFLHEGGDSCRRDVEEVDSVAL